MRDPVEEANMTKPATPLPWSLEVRSPKSIKGNCNMGARIPLPKVANVELHNDRFYIVEACNAYPSLIEQNKKLVEALRRISKRIDELETDDHAPVAFEELRGLQEETRVLAEIDKEES